MLYFITAFVNLNCSLFNASRSEICWRHIDIVPCAQNSLPKLLASFSEVLSCSLNFQPTVQLFKRSRFNYELSDASMFQNIVIQWNVRPSVKKTSFVETQTNSQQRITQLIRLTQSSNKSSKEFVGIRISMLLFDK